MLVRTFSELTPGDHIKIIRSRAPYAHHCMYAGTGGVIHYWRPPDSTEKHRVRIDPLTQVLQGDTYKIVQDSRAKYSGLMALERACRCLGEENYNFVFYNCEDFINHCIDGKPFSTQANQSALSAVFAGLTMMEFDNKNIRTIGQYVFLAGTCFLLLNLLKTTSASDMQMVT